MRVAVVADDLIWATRLADTVRATGNDPVPCRTTAAFEAELTGVDAVIVDLTARAYDGVAAIALAHGAGRPVLAVGQHDDAALRRSALEAGASRFHPYRRLYEDGPRQVGAWLASMVPTVETPA